MTTMQAVSLFGGEAQNESQHSHRAEVLRDERVQEGVSSVSLRKKGAR